MMANYCWHYFEPCCFSTFHMEHRSSSQPIWKMLNYSQYKVNYFPKGVAARRWWVSDTQLIRIPQCLQRSLAGRMHSLLGHVRQKDRTAITDLSLECHICSEIAFWVDVFIVSCQKWSWRGDIKAEFMLVICKLVCSFGSCWQHRYCKPTQISVSMMLVLNIFCADRTNAVWEFPSTVLKMLSYSVINYLHTNWDFL